MNRARWGEAGRKGEGKKEGRKGRREGGEACGVSSQAGPLESSDIIFSVNPHASTGVWILFFLIYRQGDEGSGRPQWARP